jgi:hypothetical protein
MRNFILGVVSAALITGFTGSAMAAGPDSIRVLRYGNVERITLWQNNGLADLLDQARREEYERRHDGMPKPPATAAKPHAKPVQQR